VLVAWRVIVAVRARRQKTPTEDASDPALVRVARVAELRARALAAQAAGEHLLALRLWFTALVVGLGEAGDLDYRDGFTNKELFERGRPKPAVAAALAPVLADLDAKSFGGAVATADDASAMARLVDDLLGRAHRAHSSHGHAQQGRARALPPVKLSNAEKGGRR
jgi:hypothetical protein